MVLQDKLKSPTVSCLPLVAQHRPQKRSHDKKVPMHNIVQNYDTHNVHVLIHTVSYMYMYIQKVTCTCIYPTPLTSSATVCLALALSISS